MTATFVVIITTPEKQVYNGKASSLVVPAALGYMGILAHHAPIVATMQPGTITLTDEAGKKSSFESKGKGFIEFSKNAATLLLER